MVSELLVDALERAMADAVPVFILAKGAPLNREIPSKPGCVSGSSSVRSRRGSARDPR